MPSFIDEILRAGIELQGFENKLRRGSGEGFGRSFLGGKREREEVSTLFRRGLRFNSSGAITSVHSDALQELASIYERGLKKEQGKPSVAQNFFKSALCYALLSQSHSRDAIIGYENLKRLQKAGKVKLTKESLQLCETKSRMKEHLEEVPPRERESVPASLKGVPHKERENVPAPSHRGEEEVPLRVPPETEEMRRRKKISSDVREHEIQFRLVRTLEEKLDEAFEIYNLTGNLLSLLSEDSSEKRHLEELKSYALEFMQVVLNVDSVAQVKRLVAKRQVMKGHDPAYLPDKAPDSTIIGSAGSRAQYQWKRLSKLTLALQAKKIMRVNDESRALDRTHHGGTKFYTHAQRSENRIIIRKGKLYKPKRGVSLTLSQFELCDTKSMISHNKRGYAAYVINTRGEISIFDHHNMTDRIAHSSMNAGASVLAAGEIKIENGQLKELTVHSGHYRPSVENIYRTLKHFKNNGVDVSAVQVRFFEPQDGMRYERRHLSHPQIYHRASDIITKYDQEEARKQRGVVDRSSGSMKRSLRETKEKMYRESGLEDAHILVERLHSQITGLIDDLRLYEQELKGSWKITDCIKSIYHWFVGAGSYDEMKQDKLWTAKEMLGELCGLRSKVESQRNRLSEGVTVEAIRSASDVKEKVKEIRREKESMSQAFSLRERGLSSKYKRKSKTISKVGSVLSEEGEERGGPRGK